MSADVFETLEPDADHELVEAMLWYRFLPEHRLLRSVSLPCPSIVTHAKNEVLPIKIWLLLRIRNRLMHFDE